MTRPGLLIEVTSKPTSYPSGSPVLSCARSSPPVRATVLSGDSVQYVENRYILVGQAYDEAGSRFDLADLNRIGAVNGPRSGMGARLWGDFLTIEPLPSGGIRIFREPAGGQNCYWIERGQADWVLGSDAGQLLAHARLAPNLCANTLATALLFPDLLSEPTALTGVRELLPGCALDLLPDGSARVSGLWRPPSALPMNSVQDTREAEIRLRNLLRSCVRARLIAAQHPLLQLSGGLDSSILAAVMAELGVPFRAVTVWTQAAESDERRFARAVADKFGIDLEERLIEPTRVDIERPNGAHLPRPTRRQFAIDLDAQIQAAAVAGGHDLVVHGGAGDGLFGYLMPGLATADRMLNWSPASALRTAWDEAAIHRMPVPSVIAAAARSVMTARPWHRESSFLSKVAQSLPRPNNPWVDEARRLPPGKGAHIGAIVLIRPYLDTMGSQPIPVAAPLMCSPLIDLCLSIPTWSWAEGGRNRALARRAFAATLPPIIARRRGKGSYDRFVTELFARNREKARAMLLEGHLLKLGVTDRPALERWFASGKEHQCHRVLTILEAEAWCRHWTD